MAASMATEDAFVPGSDSDYFLDMKSLKTWNGFCQIMDEDYKTFLCALNKYSEEEDLKESALKDEDGDCYMDQQYKIFEEGKEGAVNDEDGDCQIDPHYKMFLDNLREDGKSYILDIPGTVHIKYEGQDNGVSDGNGINWATPREEDRRESTIPRAKDRMGGGFSLDAESYQFSLNRRKLNDIAADILAKKGKRPKSQNVGVERLPHATKFATNSAVCTLFSYNFS